MMAPGPGGRTVAVFGSCLAGSQAEACRLAYAAGRRLAELGYTVANGGYGGTMEASARGAVEAGGQAVGVVCSVWSARPNRFIGHIVQTSDLAERLERLAALGDAGWLVLPGGTGTLLELAWVWERLCKGLGPRRPLVCLGDFWRPVVETIAAARPGAGEAVAWAGGPEALDRHFPPLSRRR